MNRTRGLLRGVAGYDVPIIIRIASGSIDYSALTAILSGNSGGIWDPANDSLNWQDLSKTIPAGDGDPVRVAQDANGVHDMVAPSNATRPIRRQGMNGEWYWDFNATSSQTLGTASFTLTGSAHSEWFAAASVFASMWPSTTPAILAGDDANTHRAGQFLRVNNGTPETIGFNGASPTINTYGSGLIGGIFNRLSAEVNYNSGSPNITTYVDNVPDTPTSGVFGAGATGTLWLGSFNGGTFGNYLTGHVYRAFFVNRALTTTEKAAVDTFFNNNSPAILYDPDTVLLIQGDGINGATSYPDSARGGSAPHTIGGGQPLTTSQAKFGPSSVSVGTSGAITLDGSSDFAFSSTQDFTLEAFVWLTSNGSTGVYIFDIGASQVGFYSGFGGAVYYYDGNFQIAGSTTPTTNAWHHFAYVRHAGVGTIYLDGVSQGSWADTKNYTNSAGYPQWGTSGQPAFLDAMRVSRRARYTANFTPPTVPFSEVFAWRPSLLGSSINTWHEADLGITLNSSNVANWADQSGNAIDYTQATPGNQPAFQSTGFNSKRTVKFTAATPTWLSTGATALTLGSTPAIFIVFAMNSATAGNGGLLSFAPSGSADWSVPGALLIQQSSSTHISFVSNYYSWNGTGFPDLTIGVSTPRRVGIVMDGVHMQGFIDNVPDTPDPFTDAFPTAAQMTVGTRLFSTANAWDGPVSAILILKATPSQIDRDNIDAYFRAKWS